MAAVDFADCISSCRGIGGYIQLQLQLQLPRHNDHLINAFTTKLFLYPLGTPVLSFCDNGTHLFSRVGQRHRLRWVNWNRDRPYPDWLSAVLGFSKGSIVITFSL